MVTLVIAHRGASAEAPENTLAAFRRALTLQVDGIELDVQVTRDGVPVVFHDANLSRLTGARGKVASKTWRELKVLRVAGTEPIPRLVDVLALVRSRVLVQIELKRGANVPLVLHDIYQAQAGKRVVLASFEAGLLLEARRLAPEIPRMLISDRRCGPKTLLCRMAAVGAGGLSLNHRIVRRVLVEQIHAAGATLWCWTVNDPPRMRELAAWGVNAILSDNPALLKCTV